MQQYQYFAMWLLALGIIGAYSKGIQQPESQLDISELRTEHQESGRAQVFTKNILEDGVDIDEGVKVKRERRNPHPGKIPDSIRSGENQELERAANREQMELQRQQTLRQQVQQLEEQQRQLRRQLQQEQRRLQQQHPQQGNNARTRTRPQYPPPNNNRRRN